MAEWMGDLYEVLGVDKSATQEEIVSAYKELAFHYHPDRNPTRIADELLKKINEAYNVLGTPSRREEYDAKHGYNQENGTTPNNAESPTPTNAESPTPTNTESPTPSSPVGPAIGNRFSIGHAIVCVIFGFIVGVLVHPIAGIAICIMMFFSSRIFGLAITAGGVVVFGAVAIGVIIYISETESEPDHYTSTITASDETDNTVPVMKWVILKQSAIGITAHINAEDKENDQLAFSIRWFVNDKEVSGQTTVRLRADNYQSGSTVHVEVTPTDAYGIGLPMRSRTMTITYRQGGGVLKSRNRAASSGNIIHIRQKPTRKTSSAENKRVQPKWITEAEKDLQRIKKQRNGFDSCVRSGYRSDQCWELWYGR